MRICLLGATLITLSGLAAASPNMASPANLPANSSAPTLGFGGMAPDFKNVRVESDNVYDYTFASAPTDWRVAAGVWEMTNRWSCSPGWSWFGGRSDEVAAVWNKRKLSGDVSAQMYFAFKMGMSGVSQWPEYPADAAISICGDGKNLGSGYVFIAGAHENTSSILMKNGEVVAQSRKSEAILPRLTDHKPGNDEMHRRWWYSRIEKIGNVVTCYLDDKPILTYTDSKPIESGQSAIWTVNNGLMLARVQLYFEREAARFEQPVGENATRLAKADTVK